MLVNKILSSSIFSAIFSPFFSVYCQRIGAIGRVVLAKPADTYHHGSLRQSLVDAGLEIITSEGLEALSLRKCAAKAGVSHAAPKNHFPTLVSLTTAIAVVGFQRFIKALSDARDRSETPADILINLGEAYQSFALSNPDLFRLMWDVGRVDFDDQALLAEASTAYGIMSQSVGAAVQGTDSTRMSPELFHWSLIHGYTHLKLLGQVGRPGFETENDYDPIKFPKLKPNLDPK